jgi:hypothetical protein
VRAARTCEPRSGGAAAGGEHLVRAKRANIAEGEHQKGFERNENAENSKECPLGEDHREHASRRLEHKTRRPPQQTSPKGPPQRRRAAQGPA